MPKILAFSGSSRTGSMNHALVQVAAGGARAAGAEVNVILLRDFNLPLYDGDLEARDGLPAGARQLKALFAQHQGLLIACPEYNSSITPLLKNAIDWLSRPMPGEAPLGAFDGKYAGLVSASGGNYGGLRGLFHVRDILQNIRVTVLPDPYMVAVAKANEAFNADGSMKDAKMQTMVQNVGRRVSELAGGKA